MQMLGATYKITNKQSNATGFLVKRQSPDGKVDVLLVSAAHVLKQTSGDHCELILRKESGKQVFDRVSQRVAVRREGNALWTEHPLADVAVIPVDVPKELEQQAIPLKSISDTSSCDDCQLNLGQELWVLCYPAQLESTKSGFPVLRRGTVASYPLLETDKRRRFLLDYTTFGGDSGGPVFAVDKQKESPLVVGLIHGQHRETVKSVTRNEERTVHRSMGLAIVVHAKYIRETVDLVPMSKPKRKLNPEK